MNDSTAPAAERSLPPRPTRRATWTACASAAGLLAVLQAGFILLRQQDFDVAAAVGLAKVGVVAAFVTVLGLSLLVVATRRWHPVARHGDPQWATRSMLFGAVAAIGAWMLVDAWVAGPLVPTGVEPWIEAIAALAVGGWVAWRPPSATFCRRTVALVGVALVVLFLPMPGPGAGGDPADGNPADGGRADGGRAGGAPAGIDSATGLESPPDVVLISIDTFRVDRVGAYGGERSLTPEIDRFAGEGFLFERAVAAAPWTVPSVASMLTGLPTIRHGAGLPLGSGQTFVRSPMDEDAVSIAQRLSAAGYETRAVVANGFLSPALGLARGFDAFDMPFQRATVSLFLRDIPLARLATTLYPVEKWADYRAEGVTDRALEILAEERSRPLFLWVHYIDLHTPFQADPGALDLEAWHAEIHQAQPRPREDGTVVGDVFAGTSNVRGGMLWLEAADRERIESFYDRAVAYVDGEVGRIFAALRRRGPERPVVAALTSDHGEEFWDHGHFEHGHDFYREVTRVPMVFWAPGRVPAGRAGGEPVGLVDVAPTLLELAGLEAPAPESPDEGWSLVPLWRSPERPAGADPTAGSSSAEPAPGRIRFAEGNLYGIPSVLLEEGPWRFILRAHGAGELYHVDEDPLELDNRATRHPELVARFRALLEPRLALLQAARDEAAPELDAETRRALQSLGYVQ